MKNCIQDITRQYELLALVLNGSQLSKADAAGLWNVSEITISRDLRAIRDLGISIYSKKNKLTIESSISKSILHTILSEYVPLKSGEELYSKTLKVLNNKSGQEFLIKTVLLTKAIREKRIVDVLYKRFYDNKVELYTLKPVKLENNDLNILLRAYKTGEPKSKTFYLSRIEKVRLREDKFTSLPDNNDKSNVYDIELKFDGQVKDEILDKIWFESFEIEEQKDHVILKIKEPITNKLAAWCISWWDTIEIVKPKKLRDYIDDMINHYKMKN